MILTKPRPFSVLLPHMLSRPVPIVARCLAPRCTLPHRSYCNVESTDLLELLLRNFELSQTDAQNELRWIQQHVESTTLYPIPLHDPKDQTKQIARKLCERRAAGEPLQYILGMPIYVVGSLELTLGRYDRFRTSHIEGPRTSTHPPPRDCVHH